MDTGDIDNHEVKAEQEEEEEKEEEKEEEAMAGLDNVSMVATRTEQDISSKLAKTTDEDSKLSTSTSTSVVTNEANNTLITSFASTTCNAEDDENEKIIADKKATTTSSDTTTTTLRQIQPRPIRSILSSLPNSPSFRPLSSITVSSKQSTTSLLHLNSQQRPLQSSALQRTTDELRKRRTVEVNSTFAKQTADIKRPRLFKAKPPVLVPVIPRNITTTRNSQSRNNKDMPMITRSVTLPILKKEHQSDHDASIPSDTSDDGLLITTMLTDPAMMNSVHTKSWSTPASVYTGSSATSSKAESLASTESNPDKEASCIKSNATADTSGDLLSIDELLDISQLYGRHSSLEPNGDNNSNNDDDDDDDDDKNGLCASFIDFNEGEDASDKEHLNDLARWKRVPIGVFRRTRHRRNSLPETMCASAVKWHHAGNYTLTSGRVDLRNGEHHNSISTTTTSTTTSTTTFAQSSALLTPAPTPLWNSPNTQFGASFHKHSVSMFSAAPTTTMTLVDKVEHDENTGLRLTIPPNNYESTGQPLFFGSNSGSNDHRYQEGESRMMSDAIYTSEQLATSSILWSTNDLPSADLANAFDTNDLLLLGLQPLKPSP
ncbi:hypothetical protein BDF22DRAFT_686952 [Syncephalis plumigaleata]|nr:hypothetical protein BDF22DRAFT_686952 [Syncephalis plumigaleata]